MRRAHSVRQNSRASLILGSDDLGVLRESDETNEDVLRRQLLDKDRQNDKLQSQIQSLQAQLAQRPPLETIQELEREYKNLDLLLQGTQRENERCMAELERGKTREKMLERELARLVGENWQSSLDIPPSSSTATSPFQRSALGLSSFRPPSRPPSAAPSPNPDSQSTAIDNATTLAHIEQVRMLILGMEQRLQTREDKLVKTVEKAEKEGKRFEQMGVGKGLEQVGV